MELFGDDEPVADTLIDELELTSVGDMSLEEETHLPTISAGQMLNASDEISGLLANADQETLEYLIAGAHSLWKAAFKDAGGEQTTLAEVKAFTGGEYATHVRDRFLDEYERARALEIPPGYSFSGPDGEAADPNLMQRLLAVRLRDERRLGNWSGTGAGRPPFWPAALSTQDSP